MAQYYQEEDRAMGNLGAMLMGALIGAATVIMANKDTRKKMMSKLNELMKAGDEKLSEAQNHVEKMKEDSKKKLIEGLDKAKNKLAEEE